MSEPTATCEKKDTVRDVRLGFGLRNGLRHLPGGMRLHL